MKIQNVKLLSLFIALFLTSCSGGDDSTVDNDGTPTDPDPIPVDIELGDIGPGGGRIFYLDASGEHGLEVSNVLGITRWLNNNENPYNIVGLQDGMGTGMENTEMIVADLGSEGTYAAKLCADFVKAAKMIGIYHLRLSWNNCSVSTSTVQHAETALASLKLFGAHRQNTQQILRESKL